MFQCIVHNRHATDELLSIFSGNHYVEGNFSMATQSHDNM